MELFRIFPATGPAGGTVKHRSERGGPEAFEPTRHIGNATYARDTCDTLKGNHDRIVAPTRKADGAKTLWLKQA